MSNKNVKTSLKNIKQLKKYVPESVRGKVGTPNEELGKFNRDRGKQFQKRKRP